VLTNCCATNDTRGFSSGCSRLQRSRLGTIAGQFVEAGAAPHVGGHAPVGGQQISRRHGFTQDGARTQQVAREAVSSHLQRLAASTCP
jgi:hypothetical protein